MLKQNESLKLRNLQQKMREKTNEIEKSNAMIAQLKYELEELQSAGKLQEPLSQVMPVPAKSNPEINKNKPIKKDEQDLPIVPLAKKVEEIQQESNRRLNPVPPPAVPKLSTDDTKIVSINRQAASNVNECNQQ